MSTEPFFGPTGKNTRGNHSSEEIDELAPSPPSVPENRSDASDDEASDEEPGPGSSGPWTLGVFLGFVASLAGRNSYPGLSAPLFLIGFTVGVALWLRIVTFLDRSSRASEDVRAARTAEVDAEQVKLDAAKIRLERARLELEIDRLERPRHSQVLASDE